MSKRQNCNNQDEDGGLGDSHVAPATKQIRLENAHLDQQYQGKEEQPQQAISNGQKRMSKDMRETPTTIKARRRSTGNKWWGFPGGGNMRDPLNLKSVKPEQPLAVETPKDQLQTPAQSAAALNATSEEMALEEQPQQQGNSNKRGKKSRRLDHEEFSSTQRKSTLSSAGLKDNKGKQEQQRIVPEKFQKNKGIAEGHQQKQPQEILEDSKTPIEEAGAEKEPQEQESAQLPDAKTSDHRKKMSERYRYGNFNHYHLKKEFHGASVVDSFLQTDPRVDFFCPDWFVNKSVLDIGCNTGRFTISLARRMQPQRVIGCDIDQHLIGTARKNIRHFTDEDTKLTSKFPMSFQSNFGPISAPSTSSGPHFPDNVWFFCENYVLSSDDELANIDEEFDIIFALATTKWVHLNWGDAGIRRFFFRVFRQLRSGGRFVLETAPFKEYKKHCNKKGNDRPPDEVLKIFEQIRFLPDHFTDFLLNSVGFSHHEELNTPQSKALGMAGRLQVFYKGRFMLTEDGKTPRRKEFPDSAEDPRTTTIKAPTPSISSMSNDDQGTSDAAISRD